MCVFVGERERGREGKRRKCKRKQEIEYKKASERILKSVSFEENVIGRNTKGSNMRYPVISSYFLTTKSNFSIL